MNIRITGESRRIRRVGTAALLGVALVGGVTACSSSGGGTTSPQSTTATSASAPVSSPAVVSSAAAPTDSSAVTSAVAPVSSASSSSSGGDGAALAISPSDIPISGFTVLSSGAAPSGVKGATVVFADKSKTRTITDVIAILPSADAAKTAAQAALSSAGGQVTGGKKSTLSVGDGGTLIDGGTAAGGTASDTIVVFTQGSSFCVLSFASAKSDPVPASFVQQVAETQAAKLKNA